LQHTVAEKVELDLLVLPPPVTVLAVDDSGLLRMKLQSAFGKATPDGVQHRTDDTPLRGPLRPLHESAVRTLDRSTKPPPNVEADPPKIGVERQGALDQVMRYGIKESSDVQIDHPVAGPASFPRHSHRVKRRAARSIAVGVGVEPGFHLWLHDHLDHYLRHAVGNGRNAERARAAVVLRYLDEPHGWRMVSTLAPLRALRARTSEPTWARC